MPPFLRVKLVKCEPGPSVVNNGSAFDPFVAVNVKECIMEEGIFYRVLTISSRVLGLHF